MKRILIGFSGKIGSGKNFIAEEVFLPKLFDIYSRTKPSTKLIPYFFSFGDHLKIECLCRNSYEKLDKKTAIHNFFVEKDQDTRDMLQKYGTENGRHVYHEDIWIRAVETWINIQESRLGKLREKTNTDFLPIFIISDVRFKNEANFIKSNDGILIRVNAPNRSDLRVRTEAINDQNIMNKIKSHSSETSLDDYEFKYSILNDEIPLEELNNQITTIIEHNLIISQIKIINEFN
jgi:hypothetical protein